MVKSRCVIFVLLAVVLTVSSACAAVKPNVLFSDGAVLQQGMRVPVWGTASEGERVTVEFQGQKVGAAAHGGYWIVHLNPLKAGGPYAMRINGLEIRNILVGEVWVCGGQSNMVFQLQRCENGEAAAASSADPMLRLFTVPQSDRVGPIEASWKECGPETAGTFSGVGYFFGRDLRKSLKVPVGLISSCVGGTPAEAWTSREVLRANADFAYMLTAPVRSGKGRPAALYNAMIAPLLPYGIKGAIWYQGEANATRALEYRSLFPAMIKNWREAWGQGDFPFLFVQLAPFASPNPEGAWAELREAQLLTMRTVPNTGMAVITDVGEEKDIHPKKKEPVGGRLALAARAIAYGQPITYSGPIYKAMKVEADKVIISFDHVDGGLKAAGGELTGFTIAGADGVFVPAKAEIRRGIGLVVTSPDVPKPAAVRYGWSNWMVVNLYNEAGLPASPFRTDSE
ncbi:MAG: sialate O-acetylesterase [Armatimonadetes bacterium]|nr:sialate O-acetylesterase [Armatimonadota bacterium]